MAVNDTFVSAQTGVADASSLTVDGSSAGTGAVIATEIGGTGGADVYREFDPDGDDSWAVSVLIGQPTDQWHSQLNNLVCSSGSDSRIRIENTSGSANDYYVVGKETDS